MALNGLNLPFNLNLMTYALLLCGSSLGVLLLLPTYHAAWRHVHACGVVGLPGRRPWQSAVATGQPWEPKNVKALLVVGCMIVCDLLHKALRLLRPLPACLALVEVLHRTSLLRGCKRWACVPWFFSLYTGSISRNRKAGILS